MSYYNHNVTLNQGFAPYLLTDMAGVALKDTSKTMDNHGYLTYLLSQDRPEILNLVNGNGHAKAVQVKKKKRLTASHVRDSISCDYTSNNPYTEFNVNVSSTASIGMSLDDRLLYQYNDEMSRQVTIPGSTPSTSVSMELFEIILSGVNAINEKVNLDLFTAAVAEFGINIATGNNAAKTINLNKDTNINPLNNGEIEIMSDFRLNRMSGRPQIIGDGLWNNYTMSQASAGLNQAGVDSRLRANQFDFYYEPNASTVMGANQIMVLENNAVQLVESLRYRGRGGNRPNGNAQGTIMLPVKTWGANSQEIMRDISYDWQLIYADCDKEFTDTYSGDPVILSQGWNMVISKESGIVTIPDDAYSPEDPLAGVRGSLRYAVTNDCETC